LTIKAQCSNARYEHRILPRVEKKSVALLLDLVCEEKQLKVLQHNAAQMAIRG